MPKKHSVFFPVAWKFDDPPCDGMGGPAVSDNGAIYILKEVGGAKVLEIKGRTSLRETVQEQIEDWHNPITGCTDEDFVQASDALAAALREAADMLDAAKPSLTES